MFAVSSNIQLAGLFVFDLYLNAQPQQIPQKNTNRRWCFNISRGQFPIYLLIDKLRACCCRFLCLQNPLKKEIKNNIRRERTEWLHCIDRYSMFIENNVEGPIQAVPHSSIPSFVWFCDLANISKHNTRIWELLSRRFGFLFQL